MDKRLWNFGSPKKLKQDQNWKVGEFFVYVKIIVDDYDPLPFLHSGWLGSIPFACGNDYIRSTKDSTWPISFFPPLRPGTIQVIMLSWVLMGKAKPALG